MTDISFPERENLPQEDRETSTSRAKSELQAKYLGDVATLRAGIAQMFSCYPHIRGAARWAYFMMTPGSFYDKYGIEGPTSREAAVAIEWPYRTIEENIVYPTIRFVTNETFPESSQGVNVLTQDITINNGSQAQIHIDAFHVGQKGLNFKKSKAPCLALRENGSLIIRNLPYMTPSPSVIEKVYREKIEGELTVEGDVAQPFGTRGGIGDCIYALSRAIEILDEMKTSEPQAVGGKGSMIAFPH